MGMQTALRSCRGSSGVCWPLSPRLGQPSRGSVFALLLATQLVSLTASGCSTAPEDPGTDSTVLVTPRSTIQVGHVMRLLLIAVSGVSDTVPQVPDLWQSSAPERISVSDSGVVWARDTGAAVITVRLGALVRSVSLQAISPAAGQAYLSGSGEVLALGGDSQVAGRILDVGGQLGSATRAPLLAVSVGNSRTLVVQRDGRVVSTFMRFASLDEHPALSPTGRLLAVKDTSGDLRIFELETQSVVAALPRQAAADDTSRTASWVKRFAFIDDTLAAAAWTFRVQAIRDTEFLNGLPSRCEGGAMMLEDAHWWWVRWQDSLMVAGQVQWGISHGTATPWQSPLARGGISHLTWDPNSGRLIVVAQDAGGSCVFVVDLIRTDGPRTCTTYPTSIIGAAAAGGSSVLVLDRSEATGASTVREWQVASGVVVERFRSAAAFESLVWAPFWLPSVLRGRR